MCELISSNNSTLISWLDSVFKQYGLDVDIKNTAWSRATNNFSAITKRVMIEKCEYWRARVVLAEKRSEFSDDRFLGGRIRLLQPLNGFRASIDSLLLAATIPASGTQKVLELGSGNGVATIALAARKKNLKLWGLEQQPFMVELSKHNANRNHMSDRVQFFEANIANHPDLSVRGQFDYVMANPPYMTQGLGNISPNVMKAQAKVEGEAKLSHWVKFAIEALQPGGCLIFIHRAERIDELINLLTPETGNISVTNLFAKDDGRPAKRALIRAYKGDNKSVPQYQQLILHQDDGSYTKKLDAVLQRAEGLIGS